jgi:periplasmic protein TonB
MTGAFTSRQDRIVAASGAAVIEVLIGVMLILAVRPQFPHLVSEPLKLFRIIPLLPPKSVVVPLHAVSRKPEGEASPPNRVSKAAEIVAPAPPVKAQTPVIAAKRHDLGMQPTAGAAPVVGSGSGSGGIGNGTGSGGSGLGGGGRERDAELVRGSIEDSDIPHSARRRNFQGSVSVRYVVTPDGRATQCQVIRSSGDVDVDSMVCRLIEKRYRFMPALDSAGRPIASIEEDVHDFTRGEVTIDDSDESER